MISVVTSGGVSDRSGKRPATGWKVKGVTTHPGTVLQEDFLKPMNISANHLAMNTRMPATRVGLVLRGKRSVTTDTALRLARYFGTSAEFWMNLRAAHDLSQARMKSEEQIAQDVRPLLLKAGSPMSDILHN